MEDFGEVSLGFVFNQHGIEYYSVQPVKLAAGYEKFLLSLGCDIKYVIPLESTDKLKCFLQLDFDYRKNVWAHLPKPVFH